VYGVRPTHFTSSVDFFLSNDQLNYDQLRKIQRVNAGPIINAYNPDHDLVVDFDHYPLMMNIRVPEPREKKKDHISITVADSPKASKKVSKKDFKKSTLNPDASAWRSMEQIV
jgi:hypothetical protein